MLAFNIVDLRELYLHAESDATWFPHVLQKLLGGFSRAADFENPVFVIFR